MRRLVLASVLLCVLPFNLSAVEGDEIDLAAERAALLEADREFGRLTAAQGLDGWLSCFADDATIFPTADDIVTGLDRIRAHYAETEFDPKGLAWRPLASEVSISGDLGYTYGTWAFTAVGEDGKQSQLTGKYLSVWRKDDQGEWQVVADIGNTDTERPDGDQ